MLHTSAAVRALIGSPAAGGPEFIEIAGRPPAGGAPGVSAKS
jgi:hypothetical protein